MMRADIIFELQKIYKFKKSSDNLINGVCPKCQKKELYTSASKPYQITCNRLNKCGYVGVVKKLHPSFFENDWEKIAPSTSSEP